MEIYTPTMTIYERHLADNAKADAEYNKAAIDYNIMMGVLEDPNADEEEEGENNG